MVSALYQHNRQGFIHFRFNRVQNASENIVRDTVMSKESDLNRRSFLIKMLAAGTLSGTGLTAFVRGVSAMVPQPIVAGMHEAQGEVRINDAIAQVGSFVAANDTVITGPKSRAVFVVGKDAFLVRENSHIELSGDSAKTSGPRKSSAIKVVRVKIGKVLSVFEPSEKRIETTTAIVGVRGTGVYVEADLEHTYLCTCYGQVELQARASSDAREILKTTHHQEPRYIYASGANTLIVRAPTMMNHTDDELIMLEGLVHRHPPFVKVPFGKTGDIY